MFRQHKEYDVSIPNHLSITCVFSSHVYLIVGIVTIFCNYYLLGTSSIFLYITSVWYWYDVRYSALSRKFDKAVIALTQVAALYTFFFHSSIKYFVVWVVGIAFALCMYFLNEHLYYHQIGRPKEVFEVIRNVTSETMVTLGKGARYALKGVGIGRNIATEAINDSMEAIDAKMIFLSNEVSQMMMRLRERVAVTGDNGMIHMALEAFKTVENRFMLKATSEQARNAFNHMQVSVHHMASHAGRVANALDERMTTITHNAYTQVEDKILSMSHDAYATVSTLENQLYEALQMVGNQMPNNNIWKRFFSLHPTWPETFDREFAYKRYTYVHMIFMHYFIAGLGLYCVLGSSFML